MGLDLLPRSIANDKKFPRGMTHSESEPCPFASANNPIGVFGTCCSFRGVTPSLYLHALTHYELAFFLYVDKTPQEARRLAGWMRKAIKQTEDIMGQAGKKAGVTDGSADTFTLKIPAVGWEFPLKDAAEVILATASWLEQVADLGFGVEAWS